MSRGRLFVGLGLVALSLGWVAARGLTSSLVYYRTPTEVLTEGVPGERVRMGGLVAEGSVRRVGSGVRFIVTDGTTRITVIDDSGVPALFGEGRGVVVEGVYGEDGAFHSDTVLVQHEDSYRPPGPGETPVEARIEGG